MSELVERLRIMGSEPDDIAPHVWTDAVQEAANRIESVTQERDDLAMLVHILIYRHGKGLPLDEKLSKAADYLSRKGLHRSPLRANGRNPAKAASDG